MIKKITKKQEAQIPLYIDKWVKQASKPIDRERTVKITKELFGDDKKVFIADSIQNAIDMVKFIADGKKIEESSQLDSQLLSQLLSQIYSQLDSQLYSKLDSQLLSQLRPQLYSQLGSQLRSQLLSQLDSQLGSQLRPQLDSQLYSQLRSQIESQLDSQLYSKLDSQLYSYSYYTTQFWITWVGYYDFAQSIGVKFDKEKLNRMTEIVLSIPTIITLGEILIVVENPKCRWSNGNLHSDEFPAIEWTDKTGIYFLNAVRFDKDLWERVVSKKMSLKEVMNIKDIDQRTQAMKYVEVEDLLKEFNAETLDTYKKETLDGIEVNYKLVKIPAHKDLFTIDSYHAIYNCPSTNKLYMSGIAPEIGEKKSIKEAMAWKGKMSVIDWENLIPLQTES